MDSKKRRYVNYCHKCHKYRDNSSSTKHTDNDIVANEIVDNFCILGVGTSCDSAPSISNIVKTDTNIQESANTIISSGSKSNVISVSANQITIRSYPASCCNFPNDPNATNVCLVGLSDRQPLCGGAFNIDQENDQEIVIYSNVNTKTLSEQQQKIAQSIANELTSKLDKENSSIISQIGQILGSSSGSDVKDKLTNKINTVLQTNLTVSTVNQILENSISKNGTTISVCSPLSSQQCNIVQKNVSQIQTQNYLGAVSNALQKDQTISEIQNKIDQDIKDRTTGFFTALFSLFQSIFGVGETAAIGSVAVCFLCCCFCFLLCSMSSGYLIIGSRRE